MFMIEEMHCNCPDRSPHANLGYIQIYHFTETFMSLHIRYAFTVTVYSKK